MSKSGDTDSEDKIGKSSFIFFFYRVNENLYIWNIIWNYKITINPWIHLLACEEGQGICAHLMVIGSILLILVTLPFSLLFVVKVVQEYERAVMFRLGLLLSGDHQWFIIRNILTRVGDRVKFNQTAKMILIFALVIILVRLNKVEIKRQSLSKF